MARLGARVAAAMAIVGWGIGCTRLTPEQQLVHDAAASLGGVDAVQQGAILTLEGTGKQFNLGQDMRPGLADQTFTVSAYKREYDLAEPRLRVTQTRTPNFAYFQGPQAQTQVAGVDGEIAYNVGAGAKATRAPQLAAGDRRAERFHHPLVLLRTALADGAQVSVTGLPDGFARAGEQGLAVETPAGRMFLALDGQKRPVRIASHGSHINLGDVTLTTTFSDYAAAGSLQLPTRIATLVDDFTTGDYQVTSRVDASGTLTAPPEAASAAVPAPATPNVVVTEVAPRVWFLAGQSHHSVLVAFKDRAVLIEAPQSEARTQAVIAKARELSPGTPLTHMVMSHHHFDHSTGLRAAIADGMTIVTHQGNEAFVKEMAARPFTRTPDALAKAPKPVAVESVGASQTITDGARRLELHHVAGNPHSDTMLMAYLPAERLLIEVDAFSPGGTYHPYAANLLETVERLKLRVDRVVPLHGTVVTLKDLVAAARPAA
jgi:glyoxylase-like metal-dependent hydrolase (beta-lactamase superfamily II)